LAFPRGRGRGMWGTREKTRGFFGEPGKGGGGETKKGAETETNWGGGRPNHLGNEGRN